MIGILAILVALFLLIAPQLKAQSTFGNVRGIAQESSGASLPDTQITLHSLDENTDRAVKADATGSYSFENVLEKYSLHAEHDGFAETVANGITVEACQDKRFTLALTIATQARTVEVTSSANQINTENGAVGNSKVQEILVSCH